jgi:hypothetical protein
VTDVWLGVIAVALVVMTVAHVMTVVRLSQVIREQSAIATELRRDLKPLIARVQQVAEDAGKVTALALTQAERVDHLVDRSVQRIDDSLQIVQNSLIRPVRQGAAVMAGIKAALAVFKARQDRGRYDRDEEDALFIG